MITSVSLQYAKALFDLAQDSNKVNEYYEYLKAVNEVLKDENTLKTLLHPLVKNEDRKEILKNTFKEYLDNCFLSFLYVLVDNDRLLEIENIVKSYKHYLNELNQVTDAIIFTKYEISDDELVNIKKNLENKFSKKINIKVNVDEKLIGGIVIQMDGKIIDGSMLYQLNDLKNELKKGW